MWHFLAYNVPDNAQLRLGVRVRSPGLPSPQPIFPLSLALAVFFSQEAATLSHHTQLPQ